MAAIIEKKSPDRRPLPDEVEAEILLRLPVKTLKRFQCVCSSWYSLISSPQFQEDHYRRAQQNPPHLLTLHRNYGEKLISFVTYNKSKEGNLTFVDNFSKTDESVRGRLFMQSCRGLVCLSYWNHSAIIVMNPSTQELISLPPTTEGKVRVGFGYALTTHQFKVVRFFYDQTMDRTRCEVFTLGSRHWREGGSLPFYVDHGTAPFLHGAVHCLPTTKRSGVRDTDAIAVFDIETEEYRDAIPLPAFYHSMGDGNHGTVMTDDFMRLMKLGGSLGLIFHFGELLSILDLWLLKNYNCREWVKGYTIDVSSVYPYLTYFFWAYPTDDMGDEDILLNCSDCHQDEEDEHLFELKFKLLGYNPKDGIVTVMKDEVLASTFCVESFFPLRST